MLSWYRNTARARSMSWSALEGCRIKAYSAVGEDRLSDRDGDEKEIGRDGVVRYLAASRSSSDPPRPPT